VINTVLQLINTAHEQEKERAWRAKSTTWDKEEEEETPLDCYASTWRRKSSFQDSTSLMTHHLSRVLISFGKKREKEERTKHR